MVCSKGDEILGPVRGLRVILFIKFQLDEIENWIK